jgi:hypothetical protein
MKKKSGCALWKTSTKRAEVTAFLFRDKDAGDCPAKLTGRLPAAWFRLKNIKNKFP